MSHHHIITTLAQQSSDAQRKSEKLPDIYSQTQIILVVSDSNILAAHSDTGCRDVVSRPGMWSQDKRLGLKMSWDRKNCDLGLKAYGLCLTLIISKHF